MTPQLVQFIQWCNSSELWRWNGSALGETFYESIQLAWRRLFGTELPELPDPAHIEPFLWYTLTPTRFLLVRPDLDVYAIREILPTYLVWNTTFEHHTYESLCYPTRVVHARDDEAAKTLGICTALTENWRTFFVTSRSSRKFTILFSSGGVPWTSLNSNDFSLPSETKPAFASSSSSLPVEMFL